MDAVHATSMAECIEYELGAGAEQARIECFAVPLRRGSSRRRSRWTFLVVSDLDERHVRETLGCMDVETVERRGSRRVMTAWPRDGAL